MTRFVVIVGQCAGGDAGAAGEGLVFHAAFVGADDDLVGAFLLYEVDVDAFFGEIAAIADVHPFAVYVELHDVGDHRDIMGTAGIEDAVAFVFIDLFYVFHLEADDAVAVDLGEMGAVDGEELVFVPDDAHVVGEFDETAAAVAAHGAFAPVRIVIFHFKIIAGVRVEEHEPVGADAEAAVAEKADTFGSECSIAPVPIVQDDEVVAGALVFEKVHLIHTLGTNVPFFIGPGRG